MKNATWLTLLFSILFLVGCCSNIHPHEATVNRSLFIQQLNGTTLALQTKDPENSELFYSYCSGVWVTRHKFLSAKHCVTMTEEMEDDPEKAVGSLIYFKDLKDIHGGVPVYPYKVDPVLPKKGIVLDVDPENDLAVVYALNPGEHQVAKISLNSEIYQGQKVFQVGMTGGLEYTYTEGYVSTPARMLTYKEKTQKFLQIYGFAFKGNSGGGTFTEDGELLGICSFLYLRSPGVTFFVHRDNIVSFLQRSGGITD